MCLDEVSAQLLGMVLEELRIGVEACPDFVRAGIRLAQERFDVVIVEGKTNRQITSLVQEIRQSRLNEATLVVVVVPGPESVRDMFSVGANFVLYKPLEYDRALSSLRAAQAAMRKDKRKKSRASVHTQAFIDYANVEQEKATLIDLAEGGMSVQFGKRLPPVSKVYFQFRLPGQKSTIRLSGQVVWQDWKGRAGVQFVDVPTSSRRLVTEFLGTSVRPEPARDDFSHVTVEVEELLQPAVAAIGEQIFAGVSPHSRVDASGNKEGRTSKQDSDNRRNQERYSCRLGAEVYRIGTPVPNRCCLTDLSAGGCYLEMSLPFPAKSEVEILVRTYEMKLRLRGAVLTSHPGYGMGVAFELKTKEERASVKKLIEFVAETTEATN